MTPAEAEKQAEEEAFEQGFHGIPHPKERAKMSPEKLAIELSKLEKGSPPYVLLEHELNLRLAKEQAKATLSAGWLGAGATLLAVLISAALGYIAGTSQPKTPNGCEHEKQSTSKASQPDNKAGGVIPKPVAPQNEISVTPLSSDQGQNAAQPSNAQPNK